MYRHSCIDPCVYTVPTAGPLYTTISIKLCPNVTKTSSGHSGKFLENFPNVDQVCVLTRKCFRYCIYIASTGLSAKAQQQERYHLPLCAYALHLGALNLWMAAMVIAVYFFPVLSHICVCTLSS